MHNRSLTALAALLLPLRLLAQAPAAPEAAPAGVADPDAATHDELRALKAAAVDAVGKRDLDALSALLAPDVVVTWANAEVSRGPEQVRAYVKRMLEGSARIVKEFETDVTVDALTILYGGDTGISYGSSVDSFALAAGKRFTLKSRWSATLVKRDGKWLIASFHTSPNLFDNPLLTAAKRSALFAGLGGFLLGAAAGFLIGRTRARA